MNVNDLDEVDNDNDGFVECIIDAGGWDGKITTTFTQMLGEDCDDADDTEYPGVTWYADSDNDTFGDPASLMTVSVSTAMMFSTIKTVMILMMVNIRV